MPRVEKQGFVVSDKGAKTRIVAVATRASHSKYQKVVTKTKRYAVHDNRLSRIGDFVSIREVGPISKTKRWELVRVLKSSPI